MTVPRTAERARDRLDRGLLALTRAGDDLAILAYALSALHGALEAHFRSLLASDSRVPAETRATVLDADAFSFADVASAMHEHLALPASERSYVLNALNYRHAQDRGDGFAWDRAGLEGYARYVAQKLGEPAPALNQPIAPLPSTPVSPPSPPAVAPTNADGWADNWASLAATRPLRAASVLARGTAGLRASHVLLILSALLAVTLLLRWVDSAALDAASRTASTPVAAPRPATAVPSSTTAQAARPVAVQSPIAVQSPVATPVQAAATNARTGDWLVVGNTDGEGVFLRRTPSMEDRLEPYDDGTRMQAVGPDVESEGRRWRLVRVEDGPVGWVPAQYLIAAPRQ